MARRYYNSTLDQFTLFLITSTTVMMFIVVVLVTNIYYLSPGRSTQASFGKSKSATCGRVCANAVNPVRCAKGLTCGGAPFACPRGMICAEPFVCYNPTCPNESDCNCKN